MTINTYNNASPPNYVNKSLTALGTYEGTLREGANLSNPEILMEIVGVPNFNYIYIPEFNRYYYVTDIINVHNTMWEVQCHCDVLKTYWNSIKTSPCIVGRNEYKRLNDLVDDQIWATADSKYMVIAADGTPFNVASLKYVVVLAGSD